MSTQGRLVGLDIVRGLAIGLVLARHATGETLGGAGIVGVVVFFALSGYLITGVLDRDLSKYGKIRWGHFYRNRALRLIPALLGLLIVFSFVETVWHPLDDRDILFQSVVLGVTYTADLPLPWEMSVGLGHLWTLAVEEQFYLLWPLILATAFRRKMSERSITLLVAICLIVGCWIGLFLAETPSDVYSSPLTWAASMAIGGVGYYYRDITAMWPRGLTRAASLLGIVALMIMSVTPDAKNNYITYFAWPSLIAIAAIAITVEVVRWTSIPSPFLKPFAILGKISYGAYLWNMPIVVWTRIFAPETGQLRSIMLLGTIPATLIAATISWYTLEAIGRHWRSALDSKGSQVEVRLASRQGNG